MDMLTESPMVTKLSYRKVKRGMSQLKIRTFNKKSDFWVLLNTYNIAKI